MTEQQKAEILRLATIIGDSELKKPENAELLDFAVEDTVQRILNYLNRSDLPQEAISTIARIVAKAFQEIKAEIENPAPEQQIASISDNGQQISYRETAKSFFANATDKTLFGSSVEALDRFRRVSVVVQ